MAMMQLLFQPGTCDSGPFLQKEGLSPILVKIFSVVHLLFGFFFFTKFHLAYAELGTTNPSLMCITKISKIILILVSLFQFDSTVSPLCRTFFMKMHIFYP